MRRMETAAATTGLRHPDQGAGSVHGITASDYALLYKGVMLAYTARMQPRTWAKLATVIMLLSSWAVPRAEACSGVEKGNISSRLVFPADGATAVPTNAQVVVSYVSLADPEPVVDHLVLKSAGGEPVPVTIAQPITYPLGYLLQKTFVLVPSQPLTPNTKYQVFSDIATLPCIQNDFWRDTTSKPRCRSILDGGIDTGATATAISSFTTGGAADHAAPTLSGALDVYSEPQSCNSSPCCGPYDGFSVTLSWSLAADDGAGLFYELSREGAVILYPIGSSAGTVVGNGVRGAFLCSGHKGSAIFSSFGYEQFQADPGNFQVVAVDMAGNRSAPVSADVTMACPAIDGGADAADAGDAACLDVAYGSDVQPDAAATDNRDLPLPVDSPSERAPGGETMRLTDLPIAIVDTASPPPDAAPSDAMVAPKPDVVLADQDAKPPVPDAAQTGTDAADAAVVQRSDKGAGCSCRVGDNRQSIAPFVVAVAWLALRRRRQRG
jgi:MYXO-CTERM domain-containing protein